MSETTIITRANQALAHNDCFNGDRFESEALFLAPGDRSCLYELPHDEGQFTLADLRAVVAACAEKDAEIERLKDPIRFVGKWVERGLFDKDVSAKDALETIAYLPGMPWNSGRWDVDHKSYAEAYYKSFPKTRAALKNQNNG